MADNDQSINNLRYNQITQGLEGFGGGTPQWTPLTLVADGGINQLHGDAAAGPGVGNQVLTLSTVNSNVGSFTSANITVDAKGRITAAANGSGGGGTPGGNSTDIQFNNSGAFGGSDDFKVGIGVNTDVSIHNATGDAVLHLQSDGNSGVQLQTASLTNIFEVSSQGNIGTL